jgi:hypothetical protein
MPSIGRDAEALAKQAAKGDPAALEAVALVAQQHPSAFPRGLLARILDLQTAALQTAATAVVDRLIG